MMPTRSVLIGAVLLAGTAVAGNAQQQHQPYAYPTQPYPYYQVPSFPPAAWNYDPYTSGPHARSGGLAIRHAARHCFRPTGNPTTAASNAE